MSTMPPDPSTRVDLAVPLAVTAQPDIPWWPMSRTAKIVYWICWGSFLALMATTIAADPVGGTGIVLFYSAIAYGIFALVNLGKRRVLTKRARLGPVPFRLGQTMIPEKAIALVAKLTGALRPGEEVYFVGRGTAGQPVMNQIVLTNVRFLGVNTNLPTPQIALSVKYSDLLSIGRGLSLTTTSGFRSMINQVPLIDQNLIVHYAQQRRVDPARGAVAEFDAAERAEHEAAAMQAPPLLVMTATPSSPANTQSTTAPEIANEPAPDWPDRYLGGRQPAADVRRMIRRLLRPGEGPWMILASTSTGAALVAFADRLAIVRTGPYDVGSARAGAVTHMFSSIAGIEHSTTTQGNGVLTIRLHPARGPNPVVPPGAASPNIDQLSVSALRYKEALPQLDQLRATIRQMKDDPTMLVASNHPAATTSVKPATPAQPTPAPLTQARSHAGLAAELAQLAELHAAGTLSDAEFTAAKTRLLA